MLEALERGWKCLLNHLLICNRKFYLGRMADHFCRTVAILHLLPIQEMMRQRPYGILEVWIDMSS